MRMNKDQVSLIHLNNILILSVHLHSSAFIHILVWWIQAQNEPKVKMEYIRSFIVHSCNTLRKGGAYITHCPSFRPYYEASYSQYILHRGTRYGSPSWKKLERLIYPTLIFLSLTIRLFVGICQKCQQINIKNVCQGYSI